MSLLRPGNHRVVRKDDVERFLRAFPTSRTVKDHEAQTAALARDQQVVTSIALVEEAPGSELPSFIELV